ncbi:MAG: glycerophosphodiester phosphodiesterase [Streptosporangiaceae bacterium]
MPWMRSRGPAGPLARVLRVVSLVAGALLLAGCMRTPLSANQVSVAPKCEVPDVVGYGGAPRQAQPNTLVSVEDAARGGADYAQVVARTTADGVPVLMRHASVNAATNGRGLVAEIPLSEVKHLRTGSGVRVPTLASALGAAKAIGIPLIVEIPSDQSPEAVRAIARTAARSHLARPVMLSASDPRVLRQAREVAPNVGYALVRTRLGPDAASRAERLDLNAYVLDVRTAVSGPDAVERLRALADRLGQVDVDLDVGPVDNPRAWRILERGDADALLTHRPAALDTWEKEYCSSRPEEFPPQDFPGG